MNLATVSLVKEREDFKTSLEMKCFIIISLGTFLIEGGAIQDFECICECEGV